MRADDDQTGRSRLIDLGALRSTVRSCLRRLDVPDDHAGIVAEALARTDAWGIHTHGVKNLRGYLRRLRAGGLSADARPEVVAGGGAWAIVDGGSGLGQVAGVTAMEEAIARAGRQGVGYVGVRNTCHFGAAGYYAWLAADRGLIGLGMANDVPSVAAPGSRGAVLGSNPIAYAVPAGRHRPLIFDISTAAVAGGKVYAARQRGESVPATWLIDGAGRPTTDPSGFPETGALLPAAGHKGYGLGLLVEVLSGALTGAAMSAQVGSWMWDDGTRPTGHGAAFLALDAATIGQGDELGSRVEALVDELHAAPTAEDGGRVLVPGEREWEHYDRARLEGVELPADVVDQFEEAASMVGVDVRWSDLTERAERG